jgi:UDP-glucose:glycoprotein glucosyltransferase
VFIYQHDKHYNFNSNTKDNNQRKIVVLYSDIGSREFKIFHDRLIHLASGNEFDYVLRHNYRKVDGTNDANKVALSGYGVELDIKSTEYKARDDTKVNANDHQTAQKTNENEEEQGIQGFMINRLKELNPNLEDKIEEFRKHLLESTLELAPLKAWQMQDLSLQAAQRIIDSNSADALSILEDLSQNYPIRARSLSKIIVKNELKKAIKSNRQLFESQLALESGAASLYINGLELSIDTTDIFSLTSVLKKEAQLLESLSEIGLSLDQVREIAYLDTTSKNSDYGVDIRDSSIQWLNDLEKDSKYSYWGRNVQELLRPTYPGMMRSIAKNFYNLVFIVDPASQDTRSLLTLAESFYVNDVPIRIGFVFVTKSEDEVDGFKDASVALFRAHNYIKFKINSPVKALSFITDVRH